MKVISFADFPDFTPNLTPREIFLLGSFGGTYWRPIYSSVTGKQYKNEHKKFSFLSDIDNVYYESNKPPKASSIMTLPYSDYNKNINKYGVKVGTTLEYWESKGWITKYDPYGWVQWYCNFYAGRRCPDDIRQIKRWKSIKNRFKDRSTPAVLQTLQHWGIAE